LKADPQLAKVKSKTSLITIYGIRIDESIIIWHGHFIKFWTSASQITNDTDIQVHAGELKTKLNGCQSPNNSIVTVKSKLANEKTGKILTV